MVANAWTGGWGTAVQADSHPRPIRPPGTTLAIAAAAWIIKLILHPEAIIHTRSPPANPSTPNPKGDPPSLPRWQ